MDAVAELTKACARCGKQFNMRTRNQRYCSDDCYRNKTKRPVEDRARRVIRDRIVNKEPIRARAAAAESGISHVMIEQAAAMERARLDLLHELNVDPKTLSRTAQQKLEIATRLLRKQMEAEYAARLQQEIQKTIERLKQEALPRWKEDAREAFVNREHYQKLINGHKFPLTKEQWRMLNMVVHPDSNPSPEVVNEASRLLIEKKLALCGEK